MDKKDIKITASGYTNLKQELDELIKIKRPIITQNLKEAGELGDLRENSEYDAAREAEFHNEMRIRELDYILTHAEIVDSNSNLRIDLGSKVEIMYMSDGSIEEYEIVGTLETDPFTNSISYSSPLGKALYGAQTDDVVSVESPSGQYDVKIVNIK